jgi:hypothetical protein
MITMVPVEIPEGEFCRFPNGNMCVLFDFGKKLAAVCMGFGGNKNVGDVRRHAECLALCGIVPSEPIPKN